MTDLAPRSTPPVPEIGRPAGLDHVVSTAFGFLTISFDLKGLRPRPWTQLQSAWAAELLTTLPPGDVLEVGSGVGQIGLLALATADRADPSTRRRLVQVDQDESACRLAERNADVAGLAERVDVRHGLAERSLDSDVRFVLIIADPPWVPTHRVRDYPDDPPWAINGGPDGLDVARSLLPVIEHHLLVTGAALLQVGGPDQVAQLRDHLQSTGSALGVATSRAAPGAENGAVAMLTRRTRSPARALDATTRDHGPLSSSGA